MAAKPSAGSSASLRSAAAATMATAMGCSERACTDATHSRTCSASWPGAASRPVSVGLPSVSVPVLSNATTCTSRSVCSASPWRNSTPISAARPVPTMMEVGVARPMAQGQAMISTATALTSACDRAGAGPRNSQSRKVSRATPITAGTNQPVTRSTSACIGRRALRGLDHADDARQHGVGAGMGHAQREAAGRVQRAAGGLHAGHLRPARARP